MKYSTQFSIELRPHYSGSNAPYIEYTFNGQKQRIPLLSSSTILSFSPDLDAGAHEFVLDFYNKTDETPDMAVEIVNVSFEGMSLDRFKWNSRYYPRYPEPWASEQLQPLPEYQESATYLGWNGRWELYFETPIFTWIHKLENLGWIYN